MVDAPLAYSACGVEDFARVVELAEQELFAQLEPELHPRYRELVARLHEPEECWEAERQRLEQAQQELESMALLPEEWTVEVGVGDHFLARGLELYAQALEFLPHEPDLGLSVAAEAIAHLMAVGAWKGLFDED